MGKTNEINLVVKATTEGFEKIAASLTSSMSGVTSAISKLQTQMNSSFNKLGETLGKNMADSLVKSFGRNIQGVSTKSTRGISQSLENQVRKLMITQKNINPKDFSDKLINQTIGIPWNTKDLTKRTQAMKAFVEESKKQIRLQKEMELWQKQQAANTPTIKSSPISKVTYDTSAFWNQKFKVLTQKSGNIISSKNSMFSGLPKQDKAWDTYFQNEFLKEAKSKISAKSSMFNSPKFAISPTSDTSNFWKNYFQNQLVQENKSKITSKTSMFNSPQFSMTPKADTNNFWKNYFQKQMVQENKSKITAKTSMFNVSREFEGIKISNDPFKNLEKFARLATANLGRIGNYSKEFEGIKVSNDPFVNLNKFANLSNSNLGQIGGNTPVKPPKPPKPPKETEGFIENLKNLGGSLKDLGQTGFDALSTMAENFFTIIGTGTGVIVAITGAIGGAAYAMKSWGSDILLTTERFRGYNIAMLGTLKTQANVDQVMSASMKIAEKLPIGYEQVFQGTKSMSLISPLKSMFKDTQKLEGGMQDVWNIIIALSQIEPEWGIQGALFALRETLSGDFMSIKRRYEIPVDIMLTEDGKPLSEVKRDPVKLLRGLSRNMADLVPPETLALTAKQFGSVLQKIQGMFDLLKVKIGNMGFYDAFVGDMMKVQKNFADFATSFEADIFAKKLSNAFEDAWSSAKSIVYNITDLFNSMFGTNIKVDTSSITTAITDITDKFVMLIQYIEGIVKSDIFKSGMLAGFEEMKTKISQVYNIAKVAIPAIIGFFEDLVKQIVKTVNSVTDFTGGFISTENLAKGVFLAWFVGFGNIKNAISGAWEVAKKLADLMHTPLSWKLTGMPAIFTTMLKTTTAMYMLFNALPNLAAKVMDTFDLFELTGFGKAMDFMKEKTGVGTVSDTYKYEKTQERWSQIKGKQVTSLSPIIGNQTEGYKPRTSTTFDIGISLEDAAKKYVTNKDFKNAVDEAVKSSDVWSAIIDTASNPNMFENYQKRLKTLEDISTQAEAKGYYNNTFNSDNFTTDPIAETMNLLKDTLGQSKDVFVGKKDSNGDAVYEELKKGFGKFFSYMSGNSNVKNMEGTSGTVAEKINSILAERKGPTALSGKGEAIEKIALANKIDPAFLAAIVMHESGFGRAASGNNVTGTMNGNKKVQFKTIEDSIEYAAKNIRKNYIEKRGLTTIDDIGNRYAPTKGATNDPNNLNKFWNSKVAEYTKMFGGTGRVAPDFLPSDIKGPSSLGFLSQLDKAGKGNIKSRTETFTVKDVQDQLEKDYQTVLTNLSVSLREARIQAKTFSQMGTMKNEVKEFWSSIFADDVKFGQSLYEKQLGDINSAKEQIKQTVEHKQRLEFYKSSGIASGKSGTSQMKNLDYLRRLETNGNQQGSISPFGVMPMMNSAIAFGSSKLSNQMAGITDKTVMDEILKKDKYGELSDAGKNWMEQQEQQGKVYSNVQKGMLKVTTENFAAIKGQMNEVGIFSDKFGTNFSNVFRNMIPSLTVFSSIDFPQFTESLSSEFDKIGKMAYDKRVPFEQGMQLRIADMKQQLAMAGSFIGKSGLPEFKAENMQLIQYLSQIIPILENIYKTASEKSPFKAWQIDMEDVEKQIKSIDFKEPEAMKNLKKNMPSWNRSQKQAYYGQVQAGLEYGKYSTGDSLQAGMESATVAFGNWSEQFFDAGKTLVDGLASNFESGFFDFMTGKLGNLNDMFRSIGRSILTTIGQIVSKMLAISATKIILGIDVNQGGGFGGSSGDGISGIIGKFMGGGQGESSGGGFGGIIQGLLGGGGNRSGGYSFASKDLATSFANQVKVGANPAAAAALFGGKGGWGPMNLFGKAGAGNSLYKAMGGAAGLGIMAAGAFLSQPGRMFGGAKDDTQAGQAAYSAAVNSRDEMMKRRQVDADKYIMSGRGQSLSGFQFGGINYSEWTSGDGWFKGPKEKHSAADTSSFDKSMKEYYALLMTSAEDQYKNQKKLNELKKSNEIDAINQEMGYRQDYLNSLKTQLNVAVAGGDFKAQDDLRDKVWEMQASLDDLVTQAADAFQTMAASAIEMKKSIVSNIVDFSSYKYIDQSKMGQYVGYQKSERWNLDTRGYEMYAPGSGFITDINPNAARDRLDYLTNPNSRDTGLATEFRVINEIKDIFSLYNNQSNVQPYKKDIFAKLSDVGLYLPDYLKNMNIGTGKMVTGASEAIGGYGEFTGELIDRTKYEAKIAAYEAAFKAKLTYENTIGQTKFNKQNYFTREDPSKNIFDEIKTQETTIANIIGSGLENDKVYGGAQVIADANLKLTEQYKEIANQIMDWTSSGYLSSAIQDTMISIDGVFTLTKEAFDNLQKEVAGKKYKGNLLSMNKGYSKWQDVEDIFKEFTAAGGDSNGIYNSSRDLYQWAKVDENNQFKSGNFEDPFTAYYEFTKGQIQTKIENEAKISTKSDEYWAANEELYSLMIERAEYLKAKSEDSMKALEDLLGNIDATMKLRLSEEAKTSKGDIIFMDIRNIGDQAKEISDAIKTNDPKAKELIETVKKKIQGVKS